MDFDLTKVEFSKKDLQKAIKIPKMLTPDLAEIVGLHIGDGHLGYRKDKYCYVIQLMGNPKTEKLHYDNYISKIWKSVFNIDVNSRNYPNKCYGFQVYSKAIGTFFNKVLEMPIGKKSKTIRIPNLIKKTCKKGISKEMISCIRGIIDTDFFVNNDRGQIVLGAWFASKNLVLDLKEYLTLLDIQPRVKLDNYYYDSSCKKYLTRHRISIRRKEDIARYIKLIGTNNPKIYKKLQDFKHITYAPMV